MGRIKRRNQYKPYQIPDLIYFFQQLQIYGYAPDNKAFKWFLDFSILPAL